VGFFEDDYGLGLWSAIDSAHRGKIAQITQRVAPSAAGINPEDMAVGTRLKFDRVPSRKRPGRYEAGGLISVEAATVESEAW